MFDDIVQQTLHGEKKLAMLAYHAFSKCPTNINLAGAEVELVSAMSRELILKNAIAEVINNYENNLEKDLTEYENLYNNYLLEEALSVSSFFLDKGDEIVSLKEQIMKLQDGVLNQVILNQVIQIFQ